MIKNKEKSPIIELKNITKVYRMGNEELRALDQISLCVDSGDFVSITGPSGSGKSTLMNIIGCLDVANEGEYLLNGLPITSYTEKGLTKVRRDLIGFVFQGFNLLNQLTALENIEMPMIYQRISLKERKERALDAIHRVGLEHRKDHKPSELSGGQQQRIAIARAIVTKPALILADEPTGNLDTKTGDEIIRIFKELHSEGNTIVMVTHNPEIANLAERKIYILDGHSQEV
jgi:putative ABC transport system ATP-binding protein